MHSPLRRGLGWSLVGLSLLLHAATVVIYTRQPDRFAAFTVMPIWLWGGIGLLLASAAFYFLRASLSLVMSFIWVITLLIGADEARVLANLAAEAPAPGAAKSHGGSPVIRVVTINCATFKFGDPTADLAAWKPDIVLFQQALPADVRRIAAALYGPGASFRTHIDNGLATRWEIRQGPSHATPRSQQHTIVLPDGRAFEVVNLHLLTAATDLRLWRRDAWKDHRDNRVQRRSELAGVLGKLAETTAFPDTPVILGGDFNAPATDVVNRLLDPSFTDAFSAAGTGWGNTFQRRVPILRIDHLYSTPHFTPVRCRAVTTRHSDHRFVVADYVIHRLPR